MQYMRVDYISAVLTRQTRKEFFFKVYFTQVMSIDMYSTFTSKSDTAVVSFCEKLKET